MRNLGGKKIVIIISAVSVIASAVCIVCCLIGYGRRANKFDNSALVPIKGGNVEVTLSEIPTGSTVQTQPTQPSTQPQPQAPKAKPTPYGYNGVPGTSKMVVVKSRSAETRPINGIFYNPNFASLTNGTIDYVTGESSHTNDDGDTVEMYELSSGRRISKQDVDVINEGYNLPSNELNAVSAYTTASGGFETVISTDWRVPYAVNAYPQDYYSGYEKKVFNIKSYTVNSLDFVFYHTNSCGGRINAAPGGLVSKVEWINLGNDTVALRFTLSKPGALCGYELKYDPSGNIVITLKPKVNRLSGTVIVIDPGHGGKDPGALGRDGALHESDQTLKIATYLASYLAQSGCTVYMTRTQDKTVSLEERREMANRVSPDIYVSVHLNSSENKDRNGTSTYYYNGYSKALAEKIKLRLVDAFKTSCYKNAPQMSSGVDEGTNFYPFFVTRDEGYASVLVETGYISNDYESAFLIDDAYQQVFAYAIYGGIADYILYS